jgi:hypothetical protein
MMISTRESKENEANCQMTQRPSQTKIVHTSSNSNIDFKEEMRVGEMHLAAWVKPLLFHMDTLLCQMKKEQNAEGIA